MLESVRTGFKASMWPNQSDTNMSMQLGKIPATYADSLGVERGYSVRSKRGIREGLKVFVEWYKDYYCESRRIKRYENHSSRCRVCRIVAGGAFVAEK